MCKKFRFFYALTLIIGTCCLESCGFSPLYSTQNYAYREAAKELANIEVHPIESTYLGAQLRNLLLDRFNMLGASDTRTYDLKIKLQKGLQPFAITPGGTTTRYKVTLKAHYTLYLKEDQTLIHSDTLLNTGSYDVSESAYATIVADESTSTQLASTLAHDLSIRLSAVLLQYKQAHKQAVLPMPSDHTE